MLYAKVKADQVISIHQAGSSYTDEEGVRYPSTIWSIPDWLDKNGFLQINLYVQTSIRSNKWVKQLSPRTMASSLMGSPEIV